MNSMNWDGLRYFLAVAESGSLSSAARLMGSNQPTVGRYIDALESDLGIKLIQRSVKGVILTQEGQYVYDQSRFIHQSVIKIQRLSQGGKEEVSGTVSLALPEGLAHEIIIPQLDKFYQQYPDIQLELNISAVTANLARGEADVALRLFRPDEADLVVKCLGDMTMSLYASKDYEYKNGLPEDVGSLDDHQVIAYGQQLMTLTENQWLLEQMGESPCVLHSDSTVARLNAVVAGAGIAILPDTIAANRQDLIRLFSEFYLTPYKVWLVYHQDLRHMARVQAVTDFISRLMKGVL